MDILVGGASGSVSGELCRRLDRPGIRVTRLSRRSGQVAWTIGAEPPPAVLRRHWDVIVNSVADTRWGLSPQQAFAANVTTTSELLSLAGPGTHVIQLSTFGVEGRDEVAEPEEPEDFHNTYEWSKARAERVVRENHPRADIVRLPVITGRRSDGHMDRFGGFFSVLRGLCSGAIPALVGDPGAYLDFASTDDTAAMIDDLITAGPPPSTRLSILGGGPAALRLGAAMEAAVRGVNEWRTAIGIPALEIPPYIPPGTWDRFYLPFARQHLSPGQLATVESYAMFRPYFRRSHTLAVTHRVPDPTESIVKSFHGWAAQHPAAARRIPRPWSLIG